MSLIRYKQIVSPYSTSPVQIGSWINGEPIYRICFARSTTSYELSWGYIPVGNIITNTLTNTKITTDFAVIDDRVTFMYGDTANPIDDPVVELESAVGGYTFPSTARSYNIYGYIDYIENGTVL